MMDSIRRLFRIIVWGIVGLLVLASLWASIGGPSDEEMAKRAALAQEETRIEAQQEKEALMARVHEKLRSELAGNRSRVIGEIEGLVASGDYERAFARASRFKDFGDTEINRLASLAREKYRLRLETEIAVMQKGDLESNYQEIIGAYTKLARLFPDNSDFKQETERYSKLLTDQENKRLAAYGQPPNETASRIAVKEYLRQVMNDPDSLVLDGCTNVFSTKQGWLVGCNYRGRNAFGGMIRQANWFTIRKGHVVQMQEQNTFKW